MIWKWYDVGKVDARVQPRDDNRHTDALAAPLEHDPEKWEPVFGKRSCSNKEVERDDDSKKNHPALDGT
jgi:hypothetical protein